MQSMKHVIEDVVLNLLKRNPDNRQTGAYESRIVEMSGDIKAQGLIFPLMGYRDGDWIMLIDGHLRLEALLRAGFSKAPVLICEHKPTRAEALRLQARLDIHRHNQHPVELSDLLAKLQAETRSTVTELAQQINKSQSFCTKLLVLQRCTPELREQVKAGKLDVERAYLIASSESDPAKQVELAKQASKLSRDQLRQQLKNPGHSETKVSSARLILPGVNIDVRGTHLDMTCVIGALSETVRILKKGLASGWDLSTACRVLRDQAKQLPKSALTQTAKGA
jgi:ParB/RepB/Spo0J family partition protein